MVIHMPKRTTVLIDEDIYEVLVRESLRKYGTVKAISKVINELLRRSVRSKMDLPRLICSEKVVRTTAREFERFRRDLSERAETR